MAPGCASVGTQLAPDGRGWGRVRPYGLLSEMRKALNSGPFSMEPYQSGRLFSVFETAPTGTMLPRQISRRSGCPRRPGFVHLNSSKPRLMAVAIQRVFRRRSRHPSTVLRSRRSRMAGTRRPRFPCPGPTGPTGPTGPGIYFLFCISTTTHSRPGARGHIYRDLRMGFGDFARSAWTTWTKRGFPRVLAGPTQPVWSNPPGPRHSVPVHSGCIPWTATNRARAVSSPGSVMTRRRLPGWVCGLLSSMKSPP